MIRAAIQDNRPRPNMLYSTPSVTRYTPNTVTERISSKCITELTCFSFSILKDFNLQYVFYSLFWFTKKVFIHSRSHHRILSRFTFLRHIFNSYSINRAFSAAKAAQGMQMSVNLSVCQSVCQSVCHAYLFVRFTSIFYNSKSDQMKLKQSNDIKYKIIKEF